MDVVIRSQLKQKLKQVGSWNKPRDAPEGVTGALTHRCD